MDLYNVWYSTYYMKANVKQADSMESKETNVKSVVDCNFVCNLGDWAHPVVNVISLNDIQDIEQLSLDERIKQEKMDQERVKKEYRAKRMGQGSWITKGKKR